MKLLKILLLITIPFCTTLSVFCQEDSLKWLVMYSLSHEANDTRLYDFENKDFPLRDENEIGVITHSLSISRKVFSANSFEAYAGIGYAKKINRFSRPYDHCFTNEPGGGCYNFLVYLEDYRIDIVQLPLQAKIFLLDKWTINLNIIPEFSFRKTANGVGDVKFDFYTIECNPGISYESKRFSFGVSSRVFQFKRIDRVLFPSFVYGPLMKEPYPEFLETYETYNPFKLSLMIGYKL